MENFTSRPINSLCLVLCNGSYPDKRKDEEGNLDGSLEASHRLKLVRITHLHPYITYPRMTITN